MRPFLVLMSLVVGVSVGTAGPVSGSGALGGFSGDFDYDPTTRELTIALRNDSLPAVGGYLVAFAFNLPEGVTVDAGGFNSKAGGSEFELLGGPEFQNGVSVAPYGEADAGAGLGGSWLGGGSPTGGLAVGESAEWSFTLSGTTDGLLTATIFDEPTSGGGPGFLVRFRGFTDGASDKVVGELGDERPGGVVDTPEPGTLVLCAVVSGIGAVGGVRRWRRKRSAEAAGA